jgi:hypothetical protein
MPAAAEDNPDMTDFPDDNTPLEHVANLRRASDTLMQQLDRLEELESRKRELPPDQPEFVRLAREIEDLARALLHASGQEVDLAEEVHDDAKRLDIPIVQPIRDTPPRRDAVAILAEWRAAERRLQAADLGSDDERQAHDDVERLREEYRQITTPTPEEPAG